MNWFTDVPPLPSSVILNEVKDPARSSARLNESDPLYIVSTESGVLCSARGAHDRRAEDRARSFDYGSLRSG